MRCIPEHSLFTRRAGYFLIAGAFLLIGVFFLYHSSVARSEAVLKVKVVPVETSSRVLSPPVVDFDSASYYRPILAYNLFRPLGWSPPVPREPYRLIATILPRDATTPATAIIETTAGKTTSLVSVGDALDAATKVVSIESKQVPLLTNGQPRTLHLPSGF